MVNFRAQGRIFRSIPRNHQCKCPHPRHASFNKSKAKGEREIFSVGCCTFYNLSSFLANQLRLHCKARSPTDHPLEKGQVVRALPEHILVRLSGARKLNLVLRGLTNAFWELGFRWEQSNSSSQGAARNQAQYSQPKAQPNLRSGSM